MVRFWRVLCIEALRATANLAPLQQMLCTFSATLESLALQLGPDSISACYSDLD